MYRSLPTALGRLTIFKQWSFKEAGLASTRSRSNAREDTPKVKNQERNKLRFKLVSVQAAICPVERLMHDFSEWIFTSYIFSMRMQAASYRNPLSCLLADALLRGQIVSHYRVRVEEGSHYLHLGGADSNEDNASRTLSFKDDVDVVEVHRRNVLLSFPPLLISSRIVAVK